MKILWLGDAGCHTGFARVTHAIGDRLVTDYGHDISVLATNYQGDYWPTAMKLYRPNTVLSNDFYGHARAIEMLARVEPDIVVIVGDDHIVASWLFQNKYDPQRILLQARPIVAYIPVDGINPPPVYSMLSAVTQRVAMSRHGQQLMPEAKLVYHGVDTDTFYPVSPRRSLVVSSGTTITSKREAKAAFGFDPDGFLVLRVDTNSGRKDYAATWKALLPSMLRHPDIEVHFHCESKNMRSGVDLPTLISREQSLAERFHFPDLHNSFMGWPESDLVALYNAADLFVSTSRGEGFGLTIAEALACGVPVIAQNVSAIPEVVGPGGILIEPQRLITVPSGWDNWLADIDAFSEAIEYLYQSGAERQRLGQAGREHVTASFDWDEAAARFDEYLKAELALSASASEANDALPVH